MNRAIAPAALAAIVLAAWPASAQSSGWTEYHPSKSLFTMGYQMSQPIGSFKNYIAGTSFRGFVFDWRSILGRNFSAGLRFDWNRYNSTNGNVSQTTATGGTISGPVFRYADQFAIEAIGHYYVDTGTDSRFVPFFGLGLGGAWNNSYQQTIDLGTSQDGFYFITTPELGLIVNLAKGGITAALHLSVLYNFTTASFRNVSNAQSISETFGLTFSY